MKRRSSVLFLTVLLSAVAVAARADMAYMPRDSFIESHWEDCRYENRVYYTDGPDGYVLAHKSPESAEAVPLPNGGRYYISNICQGRWGVLEYDPDSLENSLGSGSVSGWVEMDSMTVDYDGLAFQADHGSEFISGTAPLAFSRDDVIYAYKYPGSGEVKDELAGQWMESPLELSPLFTDPAGRQWGFLSYRYGHRDLWICLDDPFNSSLPPDENCVSVVISGADVPDQAESPAPP